MTQQEQQILLKDLCGRLPYGVKCHVPTVDKIMTLTGKRLNYFCFHDESWGVDYSHEYEAVLDPLNDAHNGYIIKPYLRPMSSMTEEEKEKFLWLIDGDENDFENLIVYEICGLEVSIETFDWLNERHFDFRGLIEHGLALEAPEGMYNLNDK